ncbi:MAG: pyrroline-5-carboxylate reductase [Hyphomicrobiales bacterium]|nr:pyrroline-5-carboxylate reductase [Hyphomicrobiales bacterium]
MSNDGPLQGISLTLAGVGKMGFALLEGWLKAGLSPSATTLIDPYPADAVRALCADRGISLNPPVAKGVAADVLVLAIKPQMLDHVAEVAARTGPDTLVISILAGKTMADVAARFPQARALVRAMPNTPAAVGRGITGFYANDAVTPAQKALAEALLAATGSVVALAQENDVDAVTAVSGSGPAYVFLLAECLAGAGVALGLERDVAEQLARATVQGAGELMYQNPATSPAQLRINVTSPGGTTAAALDVLMGREGLQDLLTAAVRAAHRRARALSG